MQITARNEYAATVEQVAAMMRDQDFNERVCASVEAESTSVEITGSKVVRKVTMEAPEIARKFVKGTVTAIQETVWDDGGQPRGTVRLYSPGHNQGKAEGTVTITAGGKGAIVEYSGDLTVNIPFIGKKIEKAAEPYATQALQVEQKVGEQWLSEH